MPRLAHRLLVGIAVLVGLAAGAIAGGVPASAHGESGVIEVDAPEVRGDLTIGLRVRVSYEDDGHPVAEDELGELSVAGSGPDGQEIEPVDEFAATDVPGVYEAEIAFPSPGSWQLAVSSDEPTASAETTVVVADPVATEGEPAVSEGDPTDEVTVDTVAVPLEEGTAQIVERGSGGDGPTPLLVTLGLALVVIVAGAVGAVAIRRRGRST